MPVLLSETDITHELVSVPGWQREGGEIVCNLSFPSYMAGINFVGEVARIAEEVNHHPDIRIGWRKVTLRLSTHSKGGLTELDFAVARRIDRMVE
ncbi:MAG: 4a-hydroxytetrahydrobiopterin dehydratase [Verrucomicrobia bacterium]|nr:4a-hydroxytetrahydrobiopterin dehydratase [Verrucomicrobiota bacterium]